MEILELHLQITSSCYDRITILGTWSYSYDVIGLCCILQVVPGSVFFVLHSCPKVTYSGSEWLSGDIGTSSSSHYTTIEYLEVASMQFSFGCPLIGTCTILASASDYNPSPHEPYLTLRSIYPLQSPSQPLPTSMRSGTCFVRFL